MSRQLLVTDAEFPVKERELELAMEVDEDATYYLRPLTAETARAIFKKHARKVPNPRTHQTDEVVDRVAAQVDLYDYCLVRWEGVLDKGKPAPCDLAHKLQLPMALQAALLERAQIGQVTAAERAASF